MVTIGLGRASDGRDIAAPQLGKRGRIVEIDVTAEEERRPRPRAAQVHIHQRLRQPWKHAVRAELPGPVGVAAPVGREREQPTGAAALLDRLPGEAQAAGDLGGGGRAALRAREIGAGAPPARERGGQPSGLLAGRLRTISIGAVSRMAIA
jgi:hypothetical protein